MSKVDFTQGSQVVTATDLTDDSGDTPLCIPEGTRGTVVSGEGHGCYIVCFVAVMGCYAHELKEAD